MSDKLIELLKIAADMPLSRIQDDEECADSLTILCGRAAEALASLQQRNLLFMREREGAREAAAKYQRAAAELSDKLHGTPCAEIRWMQDRDALRADIAKLETSHGQNMREIDNLRAELAAVRAALEPFASDEYEPDWMQHADYREDGNVVRARAVLRDMGGKHG